MNKPVFAMLLGGILGIFDGLTALISAPEVRSQIVGIVIGSTIKGVIAGLIIGLVAQRTQSLAMGSSSASQWAPALRRSSRLVVPISGRSFFQARRSA
jgi:hypothetical protein